MDRNREWSQGDILWQDLTVSNAAEIRDFYKDVNLGPCKMGEAVFCVIRDPAVAICSLYQPQD